MMDLLRIRETYDVQALVESPLAEVEFFAIASRAKDPQAALEHIETRKLDNPEYSTRQAEREIATREAQEGGRGLERAITLLRTIKAMSREVSELVGVLEPSAEADQIAELAHDVAEIMWQVGGRASPEGR